MSNKKSEEQTLVIGIVISMFLWGLSWPSAKVLSRYCSPVNFSIYRYFVVVISTAVLLLSRGVDFRIKKAGILPTVASGLLLAVYSYFTVCGLQHGTAGAGGVLITTLNPVIAYGIGIFLSRTLPSRNEAVGLFLGVVAGCCLLKVWDTHHSLFESGNIYFLLGAFTWAVMSKFTSGGAKYGSSLSFSLWQYVVTFICLLPIIDVQELNRAIHITDALFWGNLLFGSAIVTTVATTVYFYATTRLGAEKASSFILLVPFAAAVSSWLLLGEHIYPHTVAGGILGMAAVYMINRKQPLRVGANTAD